MRIALAVCAACLLVVSISGPGVAHVAGSDTTTVAAAGGPFPFTWSWDPDEVTIAKGDRVVWTNPTAAAHHITAWDGKWDAEEHLDAGAEVTLRFKKPGTYRYWCDIVGHADIVSVGPERVCVGMCGVITVE
ncbi:MAG TPA: plastocyanin/azurin family copper-binding protein [Actinomycetota bacterium]|nr:plastocyanin/azurin family copper-binding protein [Actinomycetota bacterium]